MYRVRKRDGKTADFDIRKIANALRKAFEGSHRQYNDDIINMLALRVTGNFESRIIDGCIDVEDIQDSAERVLSECGYSDVAKAYILYRKQRENIRNIDKSNVDYIQIVNSYLNSVSWKGDAANRSGYSIGGLIMSNSGAVTGNYWLNEVYDHEIAQAHRNGEVYIHDLNMLTGHTTGWSLYQLAEEGITGIEGNISCGPARHLNTLCEQMVRFLGFVQNEWAGAQTLVSFDTYLAPFVKKDGLTQAEVKQCIQTFVYGVNSPYKWGYEPADTNIVLDWTVPEDLVDRQAMTGGEENDFTYGDCRQEMEMIDRALLEVMIEGDYEGRRFRYPRITCLVDEDFFESENVNALFEMILSGNHVCFENCRLKQYRKTDTRAIANLSKADYRRLYHTVSGIGAAGENTGTLGLVTINLSRLAYSTDNMDAYMKKLDRLMDLSARSLHTKKTVLTKLMESGLYPYSGHYLGSLQKHFAMIGVCGFTESWETVKNYGVYESCRQYETEVLSHIRERLRSYQKKYETLFGLEATRSVSARSYLAEKDRQSFPQIHFEENDGTVMYGTETSLCDDLFEALDDGEKILPLYSCGGIFDLNLKENLSPEELCLLVRKILFGFGIPCLLV